MKRTYIGIIHTWFVSSMYFNVFEIEASSQSEAQEKLDAKTFQSTSTFRHAAGKLIVLEENQQLQPRTKLTWRERFTGRYDASNKNRGQ